MTTDCFRGEEEVRRDVIITAVAFHKRSEIEESCETNLPIC